MDDVEVVDVENSLRMKRLRYLLAWILVRPRRWFFRRMVWSCYLRVLPRRESWGEWSLPNVHWWLLYKTVFRFFKWLHYDAWRPFCDWNGGIRQTMPWPARLIKRIGGTTAGEAISGWECYHCAAVEGCQLKLSEDETGRFFKDVKSWTSATMDGTDHRFSGTTVCPKCGYENYFEDGSL
jgi:hypothetical protein